MLGTGLAATPSVSVVSVPSNIISEVPLEPQLARKKMLVTKKAAARDR